MCSKVADLIQFDKFFPSIWQKSNMKIKSNINATNLEVISRMETQTRSFLKGIFFCFNCTYSYSHCIANDKVIGNVTKNIAKVRLKCRSLELKCDVARRYHLSPHTGKSARCAGNRRYVGVRIPLSICAHRFLYPL